MFVWEWLCTAGVPILVCQSDADCGLAGDWCSGGICWKDAAGWQEQDMLVVYCLKP
jgi:hypothetical protein